MHALIKGLFFPLSFSLLPRNCFAPLSSTCSRAGTYPGVRPSARFHPNEDERYRLLGWASVPATLYLSTDLPLHYATLDGATYYMGLTKRPKMDRFLLHYSASVLLRFCSAEGRLIFLWQAAILTRRRRRFLLVFQTRSDQLGYCQRQVGTGRGIFRREMSPHQTSKWNRKITIKVLAKLFS